MLYENGECYKCGKESLVDEGGFMLVFEMPPSKENNVVPMPGVQLAEEGD